MFQVLPFIDLLFGCNYQYISEKEFGVEFLINILIQELYFCAKSEYLTDMIAEVMS